jgi:hypothetical protein
METLKKQQDKPHYRKVLPTVLALLLILLVQSSMMVHFGQQKAGFHEDEMATYELSNLPGGFLHLTEGFLESWQPGDFFQYPLTSDEQRAFDYSIPYHNQEIDVHPPFYYYVIHTASSLFPGTFSKWIGIVPNMLFCMLATVLLFLISRLISGSIPLALITSMTWALSVGAMSTAVFIRMYAMLTVCCLLLVLMHLRAFREAEAGKVGYLTLLGLLVCTALGILTQYYFLVFCFFLCGLFFLYLVVKKRWSSALKYVVAEFGAIGVSVLYFPQMLYHIFGGYRGKQAMENAVSSEAYLEHIRTVVSVISREVLNGWIGELIVLLAAAMLVSGVKKLLSHNTPKTDSSKSSGWLRQGLLVAGAGLTAAGYILVITKVAPYQVDRYFMCVYPLIVLVIVHTVCAVGSCFIKKQQILLPLTALLFLVITAVSYRQQTVNYLFPEYAQRAEALSAYEGASAIALNGDYVWAPDKWLPEYRQYSAVYRGSHKDYSGIAHAVKTRDLSDGFLLYAVCPEGSSEDVFFEEVEKYIDIKTCQLVTSIGCRVYYITLEEA